MTRFVRGATLAERRVDAARRSIADGPADPLAFWRSQPAFADDPALWQDRLAVDGLTEAGLAELLAEPAADLAERLADLDWVQAAMRALLTDGEPHPEQADQATGASSYTDEWPFLPLAEPFLAPARTEVAELLDSAADADRLLSELATPLHTQVNDMLTRSCVLEMHRLRRATALRGASTEDRFADFVRRLGMPAFRAEFYARYPVLLRQVVLAARLWRTSTLRMLNRMAVDRPLIAEFLGVRPEALRPSAFSPALGDRHRGGQSVTCIHFGASGSIVYKPRPLIIDTGFQTLLDWLNSAGLRHPLRMPGTLDRGDYGWQQWVEHRRCASAGELARFYFRQGALLALLYLLSANDFHSENVIAHGEYPMVIDLESIAQPRLDLRDVRLLDAEEAVAVLTAQSVLRTGLLPARGWEQVGRPGADISGIGGWSGQQGGLKFPFVVNAGTDEMTVELRAGETLPGLNQPAEGLGPAELIRFTDDLVAGFTEAYRLLLAGRAALADDVLPAFVGAECRVLARHTVHYGVVHVASFHPKVLRDGLERERHYDHLWVDAAHVPSLARFIPAERAALWNNDIPVFTTPLDRPVVRTDDGTELTGLVSATGMQCIVERLDQLGPRDLERQRWLIRASMATAATDLAPQLTYPSFETAGPDAQTSESAATLLEHADRIGSRLAELAFREGGGAEWLGVNSSRGQSWSLGALGPDLYHGLAGVSVFLAALAVETGERRYRELALAAMSTARLQVERHMLDGLGGTSGLPGYLYGAYLIGHLLDEADLVRHAGSLIPQLSDGISGDGEFDVSAGSAGTILLLRTLVPASPDACLAVVTTAADLLAARQDRTGGWLAESMRASGLANQPLAGLAHGAAGIGWALAEAGTLLSTTRYQECVGRALDYENGLFLPEYGTWRDVRDPVTLTGGRPETLGKPITAWCHGAAGIALARARVAARPGPWAPEPDVERAVRTTLADGFGQNHSLCHGDFGNADVMVTVAEQFDRTDWLAAAAARRSHAISVAARDGWLCGMPQGVETPGLLTGLAGVGYALLRARRPELPSVLAYDAAPGDSTAQKLR
ncbi:MAG TPA: type 2 lanthipeptide synthetase LanM family protein [Jatrophihabitans sp.]|nr:type 2 lanthipeptide synthetase LanM family protein [Jatrophihabitans sp.]